MSFWERFVGRPQSVRETKERRVEVKEVANSKEEHYRVMKRFAVEAGDEQAARFYGQKLEDLKMLQDDLDVLMSGEE